MIDGIEKNYYTLDWNTTATAHSEVFFFIKQAAISAWFLQAAALKKVTIIWLYL